MVTEERRNPWAILIVLCFGFFMILLDTTIVNIAIPSITDALKTTLDQILWVINAYILVYAVLLIPAGRLGDIFGPRNLFAVGLVIFTAASAVCGLAQTPTELIVARTVQGVGGALLTPQTLAILTIIFPAERRGAAFGIWGAVAGVAAVAGPTLGGLIVTDINWRWIFYINVPIGVAVLIATFLIIPDLRPGRHHRLDLIGVALASLGLFGIVFGLIEGQPKNWGTVVGPFTIWEVIAAGVAVLIIFVMWERAHDEPLLPLGLFRDRNFSVTNVVGMAQSFGMLGLFLPLIIYLQSVLGMSALEAGLTVVPMSLMSMAIAPAAGRLTDRIGGKYLLLAGLALFAIGNGLVIYVASLQSMWYDFLPAFIISGAGMGLTFAPLTTTAMREIRPQMAGAASGVLNTTRQIGGVMGSAAVGALLQASLSSNLKTQAVSRSAGLPPLVRQEFVDGFTRASTGLQVGRGQSGVALHLPAGIPPQVAHQLEQIAREVFANAFLDAMKTTLWLPVAVLAAAAITCLLIRQPRRGAAAPIPTQEATQEVMP